ncbi:MAG: NAD(P)H-dependent oxidoreductase subunit E [Bacteroidota bacterium]
MLSESNLKKFEELKKRYPTLKALVLPALWMIQEQDGYISMNSMRYVSELIGVPYGHVFGVVSFYTMFHQRRVGKHHIQICTNISCSLLGAERLCDYLKKKLNVEIGEVTSDKTFSLEEVECLGSCGTAPMMMIDEEFYENLNEERIDRILGMLR